MSEQPPSSAFSSLLLSSPSMTGETAGESSSLSYLGIAMQSGGVGIAEEVDVPNAPVTPITMGNLVCHIVAPEELCGGLVGTSGTKFCCLNAADCKTEQHKQKGRQAVVKSGMYMRDNSARSASTVLYLEPHLSTDNLDSAVIRRLLTSEMNQDEMISEFALLGNQEGGNDTEIDNYPRKVAEKAAAFKTPMKSKATFSMFGEEGEGLSRLAESVGDAFARDDNANTTTLKSLYEQSPALLLDEVARLVSRLNTMRQLIPNIAGVVDSLESEVNANTDLAYGNNQEVKRLEMAIGKPSELLKEKGGAAPSVWGGLSAVVDELEVALKDMERKMVMEIQSLEKTFYRESTRMAADSSADVQKRSAKLESDVISVLTGWKAVIENLEKRTKTLETEVPGVLSRLVALENLSGTTSTPPTAVASSWPHTSSSFAGLGISLGGGSASVGVPGSSAPPVVGTSASPTGLTPAGVTLLNDISTRLAALESAKTKATKDKLNGAVRFGGVVFTDQKDVGAWLNSLTGVIGVVPPYGLFVDPQLLLHWTWVILSGQSDSSTARDLKDRVSIDMTSDKLYAVQAHQSLVPLIYTGKVRSLLNTNGLSKSRLGQIPTYVDWDDVENELGLKQQLFEALALAKGALVELIEDAFGGIPALRAFALEMLMASISFIENLSTYMTETYNSFKDVVGDEKSVWALVTFVVEQLFRKDFAQVRASTIGGINAKEEKSGVRIMWSNIRSVVVAKELCTHGIKNAPAVSASYVRFVLTHSNMGKVSKLVEENKNLKRKLDDLESVVDTVKKTAEAAKRIADQAITKASKKAKEG